MILKLERPLAFFDLESTSVDPNTARIVEIAGVKLMPDGSEQELYLLINPGIEIPTESTAVHGISDDDVEDAPCFDEVVGQILEFFSGCDIGGYNSNKYDNVLLAKQLEEQGYNWPSIDQKSVDVLVIFSRKEDRKLSSAYQFYTGKPLENAHSAVADIRATIEVFKAQLDRYDDLPLDVEGLALYSNYDRLPSIDREGRFGYNDKGEVIFLFGKHKGTPCKDQHEYLIWMETMGNFSEHIKMIAAKIREQNYNNKH